MRVQLLPSPAMPALPGNHYSWIGWSNVRKFFAQGNQLLVLPHIPQLYSWVDWSNVGKVLAQATNSTFWESNLDLLNHRPILNHCILLPYYHTNGVLYGTVGVLITQIKVYGIGILQCTHCLSLFYTIPLETCKEGLLL